MKPAGIVVLLIWVICIVSPSLGGTSRALLEDHFRGDLNHWRVARGQWTAREGILTVKDPTIGSRLDAGDDTWRDYSVEFRARRTVDALGDGHWGLFVRSRNGEEMYIFIRPEGLRFSGFGMSEAALGRGMAFPTGEWHRFRFIVTGGEAQVIVDGIYQGTVHGIKNASGGIGLQCHRVGVEFADLLITEIPASASAVSRPKATGRKLPLSQSIWVMNPLPFAGSQRLVCLRASQLKLADGQTLPNVIVSEKVSGRVLPAQFDDIDGDGVVSSADEVCFLADLPAGRETRFELRLGGAAGKSKSPISYSQTDSGLTIATQLATVAVDPSGRWGLLPSGFAGVFMACKALDDKSAARILRGPARVLALTQMEVAENALLKRRVEITSSGVKMTNSIGSKDGRASAFVGSTGGFFLELPGISRATDLRYRHADGFSALGKSPSLDLFPLQATPIAVDFVTPASNVLVSCRQSLDYLPAMSLVGQHAYMAAGLAFGWRPPIEIKADHPHVQEVWVTAHAGGMPEFRQLDRRVRSRPIVALSPPANPGPSTDALSADQKLANLRSGITQLEQRIATSRGETTPARVLLGKARACQEAARTDLNLDRGKRGLGRIVRGNGFVLRAMSYLKDPPKRVLADVPSTAITPYVTFSEGANRRMSALGFTVGHAWLPWGNHFEQFQSEPKEGVWNFAKTDEIVNSARESGMRLIPLANYEPPAWFTAKFESPQNIPGQPPGSTGGDSFVSPELLGVVPPFMKTFGDYIEAMAKKYGNDPTILAWSVRNEPAYYSTGGVKGELMARAWRNWLARRYANVAELNANWGTDFPSLDGVQTPEKWSDNRAAWYDVMTFKAECLAGELKWESDLLVNNGACKLTGAKYVPACLAPSSARSGYGVDPWLSSPPQQGMSLTDLYADDIWENALRVSEMYYAGNGNPVISAETGRNSRAPEQTYRWHPFPASRARSRAWTLFQHGLFGCHYWAWCVDEEYAGLDWDGASSDFVLEAALANQDFQAAGKQLADLKPVVDAGYYYPRATFIQGSNDDIQAYQRLYSLLTQMGYQLRPVSMADFDKVAPTLKSIIIPPAPYMEAAMRGKLDAYAKRGGTIVLVGLSHGVFDEYARPTPPLTQMLPQSVISVRQNLGRDFGIGAPVADMKGKWKFRFGASWAQAPGVGTTSAEGKEDKGLSDSWFSPKLDDAGWQEISVPGPWEENGQPNLDGYGWYRKRFTLPKGLARKSVILSGDTLDDFAWVYVNGKLVKKTTNWNETWKVDVSSLLNYGGENVIVLRIVDTCFLGGVRGDISLTSAELPSKDEEIARRALAQAGIRPSTEITVGGVFRTLMADSKGRKHLILSNDTAAPVTVSVKTRVRKGDMPDMLSGENWRSDGTWIKGKLDACGAAWIPIGQ